MLVHGGAERYGFPREALFEASDLAGGGNALWKWEGEGRNGWQRRRSGRGREGLVVECCDGCGIGGV